MHGVQVKAVFYAVLHGLLLLGGVSITMAVFVCGVAWDTLLLKDPTTLAVVMLMGIRAVGFGTGVQIAMVYYIASWVCPLSAVLVYKMTAAACSIAAVCMQILPNTKLTVSQLPKRNVCRTSAM